MQDITLAVLKRDPADEGNLRLAYFHALGLARIVLVPDTDTNFHQLCGVTYNPGANPDVPAEQLRKERAAFRRRVHAEGIWGGAVQVRKTSQEPWGTNQHLYLQSIWGFVGNDFVGSGYDTDFVKEALEWLEGNAAEHTDPQAALVSAAKAALLLLRKIRAEQPGVFPAMRDNVEPSLIMADLGAQLDRYNVTL